MNKTLKKLGLIGSLLGVLVGLGSSAQAQLELCEAAGTLTDNPDGSFYYSSDLRYGQNLDAISGWMKRLNETLLADGTLLVVVPTPLRGMVNGEIVTDTQALAALEIDFDPSQASSYYRAYIASLAPIVAVDLLPAARTLNAQKIGFQQKLDRHWTPEGARVSAQAVAGLLRANPLYGALAPAATAFTTTLTGSEPGDNRVFSLIEKACGDLPDNLREHVNLYETTGGGGDLFAARTPLIALAGTSFSTDPYNFDGFLSEALGQAVLNTSVSGGGMYTALQDLLLRREPGADPKVIVWEYRLFDAITANKDEAFVPFRELIASVYGDCGGAALATNSVTVSGTTLDLLRPSPRVYGPEYYLHLQASDLSLVEFELTLTHEDGRVDVAPIERSTRVGNTGAYYLELSREVDSPLTQVSLTVPAGASGTVDAQLCRAPQRNPTLQVKAPTTGN